MLGEGRSVESLKAQVLKVSKIRDTRILEISVTLRDPKQAQAHAYPVHKGERKSLAGKRHKVR